MSNYWDNLMSTDEDAAQYMSTYGQGPGFATRHTIGSFINDGESVLDVGCGPGWNADHFEKYGPQLEFYHGIDLSPRFVRVATKRMGPGIFEVGDCRDLKCPDGTVDVVLLQDVLEHTNGYEKPVHEALRVAKKRVIITFWHLKEMDDPHINDDTDKGEDGYGAWYDKREFETFLNSLDYVWHHIDIAPKDTPHKWDFYIIDKETDA